LKIGIFRSDGLGDWFLTFPLITELLTRTQTSSVTVLGPRVAEIRGIIPGLEYLQVGLRGPAPGNTWWQRARNVFLRLGMSNVANFFCILNSRAIFDTLILPRGRETWGFGHQGVILALRMLNPDLRILHPKSSEVTSFHEKDIALSCIKSYDLGRD
jgi:hypothetical protein